MLQVRADVRHIESINYASHRSLRFPRQPPPPPPPSTHRQGG